MASWMGSLSTTPFVPEFWVSTEGFTVNPVGSFNAWTGGAIVELGNPNLVTEPVNGTSSGTLESGIDFQFYDDIFFNNLLGLHYVESDIVIGTTGTTTQLLAGDVLFTMSDSADYTSTNSAGIERGDIGVFRADVVGDFSSGIFFELMDDLGPAPTGDAEESVSVTSFTLIEQDTVDPKCCGIAERRADIVMV